VHKKHFLELVHKSCLNVTPIGIIDLNEEIESVKPSYPANQGQLEYYLRIIVTHKLLEPRARDKYTPLLRLTTEQEWLWSDPHCILFDCLSDETGATFTRAGIIQRGTHQVLSFEGSGEAPAGESSGAVESPA
jgi:hypothetical protein